ncbi:uncharacterized protein LOC126573142 [Anopheles aquasalis]|uniref:uncharacterized protein LOC126573142 n=1 Tax=Anopheles aquasalis TaxID=42839 RepID=UPI00215B226D|nr:uncharacterized protein LOC126573142 [Anopheles aquasalis]
MAQNISSEDDIRDLQDTTVTLRLKIPPIYKKLLLKECELEHQMLIETDICVPKQQLSKLATVERIRVQEYPADETTAKIQTLSQTLDVLEKFFPGSRN